MNQAVLSGSFSDLSVVRRQMSVVGRHWALMAGWFLKGLPLARR